MSVPLMRQAWSRCLLRRNGVQNRHSVFRSAVTLATRCDPAPQQHSQKHMHHNRPYPHQHLLARARASLASVPSHEPHVYGGYPPLSPDVRPWRVSRDTITQQTAQALFATLDLPHIPQESEAVPVGFHWAAFPDALPLSALGSDGLPFEKSLGVDADVLPDSWKRRVVGGRIDQFRSLPVGLPLEKRCYLLTVQTSETSAGLRMVYVTMRYEFHEGEPVGGNLNDSEPLLVEHVEYVYSEVPPPFDEVHTLFPATSSANLMSLELPKYTAPMLPQAGVLMPDTSHLHSSQPASPHSAPVLPAGDALPEPDEADTAAGHNAATWMRVLLPDPLQLFRFSALTFNSHRVHYDPAYAMDIEGYPGLVLQNRLLALLLLSLVSENTSRPILNFDYRCVTPAVVKPGDLETLQAFALVLSGMAPEPGSNDAVLWITQNNNVVIRARATLGDEQ